MSSSQSNGFAVTSAEIRTYADLSGDHNPLHVDEAYAASTAYGRPIAHGPIALNVFLRDQVLDKADGRWRVPCRVETKNVSAVGAGDHVSWRWTSEETGEFEVFTHESGVVIVGTIYFEEG